jgi:hypothetical protein
MKASFLFALSCFGIQILNLLLVDIVCPELFTGDSFLIVGVNVISLLVAILLFPFAFFLLKDVKFSKVGHLICFFVLMVISIDIIFFSFGGAPYFFSIGRDIIRSQDNRIASIIEFLNPLLSFAIVYFIFSKRGMFNDFFTNQTG